MAKVLKSMALDATWRERQNRIKTIECLNGSLFVHTEHRRMCRGIRIQPNDVGRFGFKLRVIGGHVALHPVRLEPMLGPHTRHCHVMRSQFLSQLACAPMRGPIAWTLPSALQNACLQFRREGTHLTTPV